MSKMHCGSGKIANVECVREGGKFILCNFSGGISDLFTARFRAPADYQAGDVFVLRGKTLPVLTQEMRSAPDGVFRAGAVVHAGIDLACARAFVGTGGTGGGTGTENDPVYAADKPSLARLASPAFVGTPTAPTAPAGTATTQLATTEFVNTAIEEADGAPSAAFAMVPDYAAQETVNRISTNNGTWTADRDGFVQLYGSSGNRAANVSWAMGYVNDVQVMGGKDYGYIVVPVKVGDVVKISVTPTFFSASCYYVPPKYIPVNRGYSTDEQLTGETWIDGKPIYKKTFTGVLPATLGETILGTVGTAVSTTIKIEGSFQYDTTDKWYSASNFASGSGASVQMFFGLMPNGDFTVSKSNTTQLNNKPYHVTFYYVKP